MAVDFGYAILGYMEDAEAARQPLLLMRHGAAPAQDTDFYEQLIDFQLSQDTAGEPAIALLEYDSLRMLLALRRASSSKPGRYSDHLLFLPRAKVPSSARDLNLWLDWLLADADAMEATLPMQLAPAFPPALARERARHLSDLLAAGPDLQLAELLDLMAVAISQPPLRLPHPANAIAGMLEMLAGLQALLPGGLAHRLTFASSDIQTSLAPPQILFGDSASKPQVEQSPASAYFDLLRENSTGDAAAILATIDSLGESSDLFYEASLADCLAQLARQYQIDQLLAAGEDPPSDLLLAALDAQPAPLQSKRYAYLRQLLLNALHHRDIAAGSRVAQELQADSHLDDNLSELFDATLSDQPDAVYLFIRNRIRQLGEDAKWIARLQIAARAALEVAIEEGDAATLASWLELISHEPHSYQLGEILGESALAARSRAREDGELGMRLIMIASRRAPEILERLYDDDALISALEADLRRAIQQPSGESLAALLSSQPELLLLALWHGIETETDKLVNLEMAKRLWTLATDEPKIALPARYSPQTQIRVLATSRSRQLTDAALNYLFSRIVEGDDRELIRDAARHLARRDLLMPRLHSAMESDRIGPDKALAILNAVSGIEAVAPADVIDSYFRMLNYFQWEQGARRLMEALARYLSKHPDSPVSYRHLWTLLESCQANQLEGAARVAVLKLLGRYGSEEDSSQIIGGMGRVCSECAWSKSLLESINNWWRDYARECSLKKLQALQRELEGERHLERQKHIVDTVLAMRRWLHSQEPAAFAEGINSALIMLEHVMEAFDRAGVDELDARAIRREVDAMGAALSSEQRHILANNLRGLSHRIAQMADKRSKPSLIRSDDSIDRQLMHGEANPHGSIDMMKWIAGYLDGAHDSDAK